MAHKLFIVARDKEQLYRSLRSALSNEPDVDVIYDRRKYPQPRRRALEERRVSSDVDERIHRDGFAVVRPASPGSQPGIIRWKT